MSSSSSNSSSSSSSSRQSRTRASATTMYKEEVLGKICWIEFQLDGGRLQFFRGQIRKMQLELLKRNEAGNTTSDAIIETQHCIFFDDGETTWFDLAVEEGDGRLKWYDDDNKTETAEDDRKPAAVPQVAEVIPSSAPSSASPNNRQSSRRPVPDAAPLSASSAAVVAAPIVIPRSPICSSAAPVDLAASTERQVVVPVTPVKRESEEEDEDDEDDEDDRKPAAVRDTAEAVPSSAPSSTVNARVSNQTPVPDAASLFVPSSAAAAAIIPRSPVRASTVRSTSDPNVALATSRKRLVVVTPEKRETKKARIENRAVDSITSDDISLRDFEFWLRTIHVGSRGNPLSKANGNSVMRQVRRLVNGYGVEYKNWPAGTFFKKGTKVNLGHDLSAMYTEAKLFEQRYGKDLGNGWLLQHPIKKLLLYKDEYALPIRATKRRFLHFLGSTGRTESPSSVVSGKEDVLKTIFSFSVRNKE